MTTKKASVTVTTRAIQAALAREPGLTVKDLADQVGVNRQFMAGFLAALEERGEVSCRKVGPARIYFNPTEKKRGLAANR
jgi:predicted ArsR family transcriptional regulator